MGRCGCAPAPGPPGAWVGGGGAQERGESAHVDGGPRHGGVLRRHRWRQQKEAEDHGRVWDRGGYMFTAVGGGVLAPKRLSRLFRKVTLMCRSPVKRHEPNFEFNW